jgi:hypothetical protein
VPNRFFWRLTANSPPAHNKLHNGGGGRAIVFCSFCCAQNRQADNDVNESTCFPTEDLEYVHDVANKRRFSPREAEEHLDDYHLLDILLFLWRP